jgi:hypothetical protein
METVGDIAITRNRYDIIVGDDRYLFYININSTPQRIFGFKLSSYRTCGHYFLSPEVWGYCESHLVEASTQAPDEV